jgi:DNA-binding transcriptional LysR family regulator
MLPLKSRSSSKSQDLDLLSLRLFVRLCEERNLAKVGQKFGLMPSAISKRMARLEDELDGTPLFKRLRHGLEPTMAGQTFLKHVQNVLEGLDKAANELRGYNSGHNGQIRMLAPESSMATFLTEEINVFLKQPTHSNLSLHLHIDNGGDVVQMLNEEIYNLGVLWNVQDTGSLTCLPYHTDHLCAVVPQSHELAARTSLAMNELEGVDMVSVQSIARAEARIRRMKTKVALPPLRIRLVMPSILSVLESVRADLGVGFAPQDAQHKLPNAEGLTFIPLEEGWAKRHFVVCYKDSDRTPVAAKKLAHFLSEQAQA